MSLIISCDTTASFHPSDSASLGISILPLNVIVNGQEYLDGISIEAAQLASFMRQAADIKTSTPTPAQVKDYFDGLFAKGATKIVHLTISSKLSSIYSMFTMLCQEEYGDKVIIFDSLLAGPPMGNEVLHALKLANKGSSATDIISSLESRRNQSHIYFMPDNLTYLKRGGRVSPAVAIIGNLIGIKPLLTLTDGAIDKVGTVRTVRQGMLEISKLLAPLAVNQETHDLFVMDFDGVAQRQLALATLPEHMPNYTEPKTSVLPINVAAHTGPGTVGIAVCLKP